MLLREQHRCTGMLSCQSGSTAKVNLQSCSLGPRRTGAQVTSRTKGCHQLHQSSRCNQPLGARRLHITAASGVAAVASGGLPAFLLSAGIFLLGAALAVMAVAAVPLLLEMRRTAQQMRQLTLALEREVPDTAATLRLTGLEMSDAIQEVSMLSMDVTGGLQASARMLQDAESGMKQSVAFVQTAASQKLLPAIRSRVANASAKGALEQRLTANKELQHTRPTLLQLALATKVATKRIRFAIGAADIMGKASALTAYLATRNAPPGNYPLG